MLDELGTWRYTFNMSQDWTKLYKKYKGSWVALLDDEITVVGVGENAAEAFAKAQKKDTLIQF